MQYKGKIYYFCTPLCMVTFQNDPEKYLKGRDPDTKKYVEGDVEESHR
ncbi:MAG: YHS domain-containing protein [bacterium]